ncbi:hypothetical protein DH2020_022936 [Rehmannia glutinosa]|uniref:DUF1421 domain-containing protein n=1 Tax=Rehmannia glutinosa TaxID=99300 RepID=A0ABR0W4L1_REHGL
MASGSSGRTTNSGSKAFDFGSDDILCSYEDYGNQDGNNGIHTDPSSIPNSAKQEFNKSRVARSSVFPAATYGTPEESSFNQGVISTVENTMKKYTDNIMRFLEGISSRLSQLELYCYNLDKSIGEMRSDLVRDHGDSESKLKSLERHIQEVCLSMSLCVDCFHISQVLRDKQELADTQKELAKLQLAHKESSSAGNPQPNEERTSTPASEAKQGDNPSDSQDKQLALALPHQVAPQPSHPQQPSMAPPPSSMPPQSMAPQVQQPYYLPPPQMTNITNPSQQPSQPQYLPTQPPPQVNQTPQVQSLPPPYQQQWAQQQPPMQPQIRASSQVVYSSYHLPTEMVAPSSMPMQASQQPGSEATPPYGYNAAGRPIQQQPPPPQHLKTSGYGAQSGTALCLLDPLQVYILEMLIWFLMVKEEGHIIILPHTGGPHFQQNVYPPTSIPPQNPQRIMPSASMRSHPYNELIEKLVGMGYRGDHVVGIIQRLEESGQPIDFNSVLDRLNGHGGSQRGWST